MSPNYLPGGRSIEATRWGRVEASIGDSSGRLLAQGSSINLFWTPLKLEHRARERYKWKGGTLGHSTINQRRRAIELSYRRCSTLALENPGEHRPPAAGRSARSGPPGGPTGCIVVTWSCSLFFVRPRRTLVPRIFIFCFLFGAKEVFFSPPPARAMRCRRWSGA